MLYNEMAISDEYSYAIYSHTISGSTSAGRLTPIGDSRPTGHLRKTRGDRSRLC